MRIAARRVASARVEFALQQRESGGDWGERLLLQQRLFPLGTSQGRWLVSSPLTLSGAPWEVRIAARERAEAQAASGNWQRDFDYDARLASERGVWFVGTSASINSDFGDVQAARMLSEVLLNEKRQRVLGCELCTHLGVGSATRRGRTFATVVIAGPAPTGDAIAAAEAQMAGLVNRLREGLGLDPVTYHDAIAAVARRWSQTQAAEGEQYHNPHFSEQYPSGWRLAGENVASLPGLISLSDAVQRSFENLVNSSEHYAIMTNPRLTHLGVGIAVGGGFWVTQNFARDPARVQPTQSAPPGPTTVTATGGANRFSARWSAVANGAAVTSWEFVGHLEQTFDDSVRSFTWTSLAAGRYTIEMRACNDAGCGAWGSATVTVTDSASGPPEGPATRRVELTRGANAQNVTSGCTSANCHFLRVELVNFAPGTYTVRCHHDGVAGHPAGQYHRYATSKTISEVCIWGFAGHDTYVEVEDPRTGEIVRSNDAQWP